MLLKDQHHREGGSWSLVNFSVQQRNRSSMNIEVFDSKVALGQSGGQRTNFENRFTIQTQYFSPNGNVAWEAATLERAF